MNKITYKELDTVLTQMVKVIKGEEEPYQLHVPAEKHVKPNKLIQVLNDRFGDFIFSISYKKIVDELSKIFLENCSDIDWQYFEVPNNGLYMRFESDKKVNISTPNGFKAEVTSRIASIIISIFAFDGFLHWLDKHGKNTEIAEDTYYSLLEYAKNIPEKEIIMKAIK